MGFMEDMVNAAVMAAESSTAQVSECNACVVELNQFGNYRGWFNPTASRGTVRYIYPN